MPSDDATHNKQGVHAVAQPVNVQQDGVWVGTKRRLNFVGATVTSDDDTGVITVTVDGGGMKTPTTILTNTPIFSLGGLNDGNSAPNLTTAWPTANLALFVPFTLFEDSTLARLFWYNGTVVSGNVDCAVYNDSLARQISTGSTAQSGTSALQIVDVADTVLAAGRYYFAIAQDNTTGRIARIGGSAAVVVEYIRAHGQFQQASAFALPSTATPAANAQAIVPIIGAEFSRVV